ncbi:hypothetical protein DSL72_000153 [Monilinia vaccinii-corymbosi]|uniref:Uncharacterized protein n=1 Tax=Monilinia vaccinii-corymbosi TaxID=61207 RepID=A0A8A3P5B4_9HELO|nr:hypothetical protein DSL72_000153 [Monilinia vaccinii-corymbosi]
MFRPSQKHILTEDTDRRTSRRKTAPPFSLYLSIQWLKSKKPHMNRLHENNSSVPLSDTCIVVLGFSKTTIIIDRSQCHVDIKPPIQGLRLHQGLACTSSEDRSIEPTRTEDIPLKYMIISPCFLSTVGSPANLSPKLYQTNDSQWLIKLQATGFKIAITSALHNAIFDPTALQGEAGVSGSSGLLLYDKQQSVASMDFEDSDVETSCIPIKLLSRRTQRNRQPTAKMKLGEHGYMLDLSSFSLSFQPKFT